jgi:hypothetical protein
MLIVMRTFANATGHPVSSMIVPNVGLTAVVPHTGRGATGSSHAVIGST